MSVVPGPFTIDGKTVEYISFLKGGYPSKDVWYYSTDGLTYTQVSSKFVDKTLSGAASKPVATGVRPDADWNAANTNSGMTTLGERSQLAAPDYPSTTWSLFDGNAMQWTPVLLGDGTAPNGIFLVDSIGRLHNVIPQGGRFTYRWSSNNGATWASLDVPLPDGAAIEELDFRANRAAGVAAVLVHAQDNTTGSDVDLVYKIGISKKDTVPRLQRRFQVGLGDMNATSGLGNDVRMDFQSVTIFPDGRVAVSFLDSTTKTNAPSTGVPRPSPAVAIELSTKITGRVGTTEPVPAGTAQPPISGSVTIPAPGAGNRVAPLTSAYLQFSVPAGADDAAMIAQATPLLPADIDLYLQRQLADGTWSGDLASGTSSSLTDEVLESSRLLAGNTYRIEAHNWSGPPDSVGLELTFFKFGGGSRIAAPARAGLLLALAFATGCGGSDSDGAASAGLPSCAEETRRVDPPADLPDELPLPDGLVLTDAQHPGGKEFRLRGVVRGDLDGVAELFKEQLPAKGFELKESEAEEHEQEGEFEGHDYEGSWRVVKNPTDCPVVAVFVTLGEER